jgi:O-antigen/teichoic acid export membrane protein
MSLDTLNSTLAGVGRIDLYLSLQLLSQVLSVGITLLLVATRHGILSFVAGNAVAYATLHIVSNLTLRHILGRGAFCPRRFSWQMLKKILSVSLYLSGSSILNMLVGPLNKLLLARYVGVSALPTYDIIINGSGKMRSLLDSAMRAIMPEISRLASLSEHANISRLNRRISRNLLVAGGTVFTLLLLTCGFGVKLWLGKLAAHFPVDGLRIVLVGTFFGLLGVPAFYTLLGLGRSAPLFLANLLQSAIPVLSVLAIVTLGHALSLINALQATALGMIVANFYLIWQNSRAMKSLSGTA